MLSFTPPELPLSPVMAVMAGALLCALLGLYKGRFWGDGG